MGVFDDLAGMKLRYSKLSDEEKIKLLEKLRTMLEDSEDIAFAYVHGSFVEGSSFRDLDVAIWIKKPSGFFNYVVNLSAKASVEVGVPVDLQVLNEAPLPFKNHVFTRGKVLFSRNEDFRLALVDVVVRQYEDLKLLTRIVQREFL